MSDAVLCCHSEGSRALSAAVKKKKKKGSRREVKKKETKWTGLLCARERFSQHQLRKCLLHVCNNDCERWKFNRSRNLERNLDLRIKQKCDFAKLPLQERLAHVLERFHKLVKMNGTHWIGFNISNACFNILALRVRVDSFDFYICNSPLKRTNIIDFPNFFWFCSLVLLLSEQKKREDRILLFDLPFPCIKLVRKKKKIPSQHSYCRVLSRNKKGNWVCWPFPVIQGSRSPSSCSHCLGLRKKQ